MSNHESDFETLTIHPEDVKAGDRILLGEKAVNQPVATSDAQVTAFGGYTFISVECDNGVLNLNHRFDIQVRRNKAAS